MSAEIVLAGAAVAGVCITGGALIVSLRRNGRDQKARDEAIARAQHDRDKDIERGYLAIAEQLKDESTGLSAINRNIANQAKHCAETVGRFDERIKKLEH